MKRIVTLLLYCALSCAATVALAESTDGITIGTRRVVESKVLKEGRTVHIYLPESYAHSRGYTRYPVLYVRDGGKFFHSFTGAIQQLTLDATPHAPEMIVVAIVETDRVRVPPRPTLAKGDKPVAGSMYEKSLLLNPHNDNAKQMLRSLRAE